MIPSRIQAIYEVTKKEMLEHFKTKRLIVIGIVFAAVFLIISVYGGILLGAANPEEHAYEQGSNAVLNMVLTFTNYFPVILAIALTYDTIVGERVRKSMYLLLSKPIDRDSVFIGKFLGSFISICLIYLIVISVGYSAVIGLSGIVPSMSDVVKAYEAIGIILLGTACWIVFTMLFSSTLKTTTSCIIVCIVVWIFILPIVSQIGIIYQFTSVPINNTTGMPDFTKLTYPWYAKVLYATNPSNCMNVHSQLLTADLGMSFSMLTVEQSLIALCTFFIVIIVIAMIVFRKIELD
jgi:ABC-2 type transport system permease protein